MPAPLAEPHTVIYDWRPYRGFAILNVFAGALRIGASVDDELETLLARIPASTDTFLFNLDLSFTSRFPAKRQELLTELRRRGVDVWNAFATDSSKRHVQQVCRDAGLPCAATPKEGDPHELVIVKSNANFGSKSERALSRPEREKLHIAEPQALFRSELAYLVASRRDVPDGLWQDEGLAIERYIRNAEHLFYRLRFVFDTWVISEVINPHNIKKMENCTSQKTFLVDRWDRSSRLPDGLMTTAARFIDAFRLDYGALDVALDDRGDFYVVDANPTPGLTTLLPGQAEAFRSAWDTRRKKTKSAGRFGY
jgi:hypothetical protein